MSPQGASRRRTPRRHQVHPTHPRYNTTEYNRGTGDGVVASSSGVYSPGEKSDRDLQDERLEKFNNAKRNRQPKPSRSYRIYASDSKHFGRKPESWKAFQKSTMLQDYGVYLADIRQEGDDPVSYADFSRERIILSRASSEEIEMWKFLQRLEAHKEKLANNPDMFTYGDSIDIDYIASIRPEQDGGMTVFRIGSEESHLEVDTLSADDTDQMIEYIQYEDLKGYF